MSLNNFFKQKQIDQLKQQQQEKLQKEQKINEIRKVQSVQFKARVTNRIETFQGTPKLKQSMLTGTYPILPLTKHSFRDRVKEKELNGNLTLKHFLPANERATQSMQDFKQGHLSPGEFNNDQPHKNHYKWLKVEDPSQQGEPMRYGLGDRFETERVKKVIQYGAKNIDYVRKDLKMLIQPNWRNEEKEKWMDSKFNYSKQGQWDPTPINYQNQNNVFVEGFEVLGDPTRKRYKEQEHKRTEFIPTVKEDQIGTAMHISRSLRTYQADQILQEQTFDQYSKNQKLKFYKQALITTKSVDHLTPHQHSNNFKSIDFKNLRPDQKNKIFRLSLTGSTAITNTPIKTAVTKYETEQTDNLQTKLSNIQEISQQQIDSDKRIYNGEYSKTKSSFQKQQSLEALIKLKYPYHQEDDATTQKKISQYFKWNDRSNQ